MKTRITELLGIEHPILLAGMAYVSLPKLTAAVSNAGGLGVYNCAANTPSQMRDVIKEIRSLTDKPFAVNVPLLLPNAKENAEIALEEKVPVLNYLMGKGDWIIKAAHEYGGKVLSTVTTERHALRAASDGADAIISTGHEGGGHGGDVGSLVMIPIIASQINIPIVAAGGFSNGKGLAAALVLGADGISMGTRFLLAQESQVHEHIKDVALKATSGDTVYTDKIDGMPCRFLKTKAAMEMVEGKVPILQAISDTLQIKRMLNVPFFKLFRSGLKQRSPIDLARQAVSMSGFQRTLDTGDLDSGFMSIGQVTGSIDKILSCREIIEQTVTEAQEVIGEISKQLNQ